MFAPAVATPVGAWEATWAETAENESASISSPRMGSRYFIIPRLAILAESKPKKKRERIFSPSFVPRRFLLELRGDGSGVVAFIRFAKVALAAELRRRGRRGLGIGLKVRVVGAVDEEVGGIVLAAAVIHNLVGCAGVNTVITCWLWQVVQATKGLPAALTP